MKNSNLANSTRVYWRVLAVAAVLALAPLGATQAGSAKAPAVGQPAPSFEQKDESGKAHSLASYRGSVVVLEWTNPDCPYVARHYRADTMEKLAQHYDGKRVVWLAVNSTEYNKPEDTLSWKSQEGFPYPTLQDAAGDLGRLYGARTTPHMYVIDPEGVLRYKGAIDDDPRGRSATRTNYVAGALDSLLAGATPSPSQTQPYGCSVKYAQH